MTAAKPTLPTSAPAEHYANHQLKLAQLFSRLLDVGRQAPGEPNMALRLSEQDITLMVGLGEHRFLASRQVAFLNDRSADRVMKRLRALEADGLVQSVSLSLAGRPGRPESLYALTKAGADLVAEKAPGKAGGLRLPSGQNATAKLAHENLINWFQLHLLQIERTIDGLETAFTANPMALTARPASGGTRRPQRSARKPAGDARLEVIPDGALMIRSPEQAKSLLFLLEVDMGTEPRMRSSGNGSDISGKIQAYQRFFREGGYKSYERVWPGPFVGFRVLFLTSTPARLANLCRLVRESPPSDFIWLTSGDQMFTDGLSARVWVCGGRDSEPLQSILGDTLARPAPILSSREPKRT